MSAFTIILIFILLISSFVHTLSYGIWTWKKNKPGAIVVFVIAFAVLLLPIVALYLRD